MPDAHVIYDIVIIQSNDIPDNRVDTRSLAALIIELNIARRNCRAYPKGHPVIAASLAKALQSYEDLLHKHTEIILGITSDALMVDGTVLDKSNVVFRDFSRVLFERGIGAILFHHGLTLEELSNFTTILGLKRELILQHGGIEQIWTKARIAAMTIRPIRYELFKTTDQDPVSTDRERETGEGLWARFARELIHDKLPGSNSSGAHIEEIEPEILAEVLNQEYANGTISHTELQQTITAFLAPLDSNSSPDTVSGQPYQKLAAFISKLSPKLRRQFLESSFGTAGHAGHNAAERIFTNLSEETILETLDDINHDRLSISPVVFGLLQRLGRNAGADQNTSEELSEEEDLSRKMKTLLREHASEEFVPDDYQRKLNHIIASDKIQRLNVEESESLLKTLDSHSVESSIGQILMNLIREGAETPEERDMLLQNLSDMFGFFLQTGDYGQLHRMIDQMSDGTFPVEIQYRLRDEYGRREFLEEILDGLSIWGKPRYDDIRSLIHKIRSPFVEVILDRLAEEKNMSLRRFYMDRLIELGPATRVPIVNRLYDTRWYFLRNLLIILTAQNDPSITPLIRPLLRSEDPRLRHEALKALVHFHDNLAEKQILDELDSHNPEQQLAAILLAEKCISPAISAKLAGMLSMGGFSQPECEKKSHLVHALGEIGRADVLPELAKILGARSLLNSRHLTKLKSDIVRSLTKYPPAVSRPVLEHIADGSGDVARLAAETLKSITGKQS